MMTNAKLVFKRRKKFGNDQKLIRKIFSDTISYVKKELIHRTFDLYT